MFLQSAPISVFLNKLNQGFYVPPPPPPMLPVPELTGVWGMYTFSLVLPPPWAVLVISIPRTPGGLRTMHLRLAEGSAWAASFTSPTLHTLKCSSSHFTDQETVVQRS